MGAKGETTKDRIVKAARHLFKYQGYRNTTIDDISRVSGVKRGNLFFYFKSKEELAHAAIEDALKMEAPFLDRVMGQETDPLRRVELMIDGMVGHVIAHGSRGG
jgi:AcrR family transcriptional regulator